MTLAKMSAEIRIAEAKARAEGFQRLLADPMTKFIISQIPAGPDDALMIMLRSTFDAGFNAGTTSVITMVAEHVMAKEPSNGD